jgi:predicted transcriptional regulator
MTYEGLRERIIKIAKELAKNEIKEERNITDYMSLEWAATMKLKDEFNYYMIFAIIKFLSENLQSEKGGDNNE